MVLLTRDIVVSVLLVELENNAKKVWAEFEFKLPGSSSEWRLNNYWKCSENFPTLSKGSSHIERFHSRGQYLCKFIWTKGSLCIRKEFHSHRTGLGHKHGRRFIALGLQHCRCFNVLGLQHCRCFNVLGHQHGRRDVMWKHSIPMYLVKYEHAGATFFLSILRNLWRRFVSPYKMRARAPFWKVWNAKQQGTQGNHRVPKKFKNCVYQIYSSPLLFYLSYRKMGKTELSSALLRSTRRWLWGVCI